MSDNRMFLYCKRCNPKGLCPWQEPGESISSEAVFGLAKYWKVGGWESGLTPPDIMKLNYWFDDHRHEWDDEDGYGLGIEAAYGAELPDNPA